MCVCVEPPTRLGCAPSKPLAPIIGRNFALVSVDRTARLGGVQGCMRPKREARIHTWANPRGGM
eukprot:9497722-Pyramimonas_sp.AAC.1